MRLWLALATLAAGMVAASGSAGEPEPQLTFVRGDRAGLFAIPPDGGPETRVVADQGSVGPFAWSPDGSRIAFVTSRGRDGSALYVARADGGGERRLARRTSGTWSPPVWAPGGQTIAFEQNDRIVLVSLSTGVARPLRLASRRDLHPAWSPDGREIAHTTTPRGRDPLGPESRVVVTNVRTGKTRAVGAGALPAWSPDGTRLAFRGAGRLSVVSSRGGRPRRVSNANVLNGISWSPNGRRLLFAASSRGVAYSIRTVAADGSDEQVLSETSRTQGWPAWSPGGTRIAFVSTRDSPGETGSSVYAMNADGSCETRLTTGGRIIAVAWRPVGDVPPLRCAS
jgi:Tol biopolymer transport system component